MTLWMFYNCINMLEKQYLCVWYCIWDWWRVFQWSLVS